MVSSWKLLSACTIAASGVQVEESSLIQSTNLRKDLGQTSDEVPVMHDLASDAFPWKASVSDKHGASLLQEEFSATPVKVVGLFNTGTNYLQVLLDKNLGKKVLIFPYDIIQGYREAREDEIMAQANECLDGWKHVLPRYQPGFCHDCNTDYAVAAVLGVIRNPITWLQSMSKPHRAYDLTSCFEKSDWADKSCSWPSCTDKQSWDFNDPDKEWCEMTSKCSQRTMENCQFENPADIWIQNVQDYEKFGEFGFWKHDIVRYEDIVLDTKGVLDNVTSLLGNSFHVSDDDFQEVTESANPQPLRCNDCIFDAAGHLVKEGPKGCDDCLPDPHSTAVRVISNQEYLEGFDELDHWCKQMGSVGRALMCKYEYNDCGC